MNEENDKELAERYFANLAGCCLGAVSAPVLFILFLFVLYYVAGDFDAEGVPFFVIMSVPCGAIAGAVLWPIVVRVGGIVIQAIKRKSK